MRLSGCYNPQTMNTVSLIGMPGAGKSTVGVILAKLLRLNFVDTDLLIQLKYAMTLQKLLDRDGYLALRRYEEELILSTHFDNTLVSTGGSAVYSEAVMQALKRAGPVVFIDVELPILLGRVSNEATRGIACPAEFTLQDIYSERLPLYRKYADFTLPPGQQSTADISASYIAKWLAQAAS